MKPWAKLEQNYINHPKFLALSASAICLWLEGKNYCDINRSDGMIPHHIVKSFRFFSKANVVLLTTSCGHKTADEAFVPLWEAHVVGFKMHDYLDYNDCRDVVTARIDQADQNRALDREYKRRARDAKQVKASGRRPVENPVGVRSEHPVDPVAVREMSGSIQKQQQYQKQKDQEQKIASLPPDARSKRPLFTGQRLTVFEWQLDDCMRTLGAYADDFDLHTWFYAVDARLVADGLVIPKRDGGEWLQAQLVDEAQRRGLALKLATVTKPGAAVELSNEAILAEIRRQDERVRRQ